MAARKAGDVLAVRMTHLCVRVHQGDITKQHTDVIVSSCGPTIGASSKIQGQAGKAMSKAGGPKYVAECNKIGTICNDLAITTGGNLPCKMVFHLVMTPDMARWPVLVHRALNEAETQGLATLTFPALGTGRLSIDAKTSAGFMFDAIHKYDSRARPRVLKNLYIVVFNAQMVNEFREAFSYKARMAEFPVQYNPMPPMPPMPIPRPPMPPMPMPKTPKAKGPAGNKVDMWAKLLDALEGMSVSPGQTTVAARQTSPGGEAPSTKTVTLTDPFVQAAVPYLTVDHLNELRNLNVKVEIDKSPKGKILRVRVLGEPLEAAVAIGKFYEILHQAHNTALSQGQLNIQMPSDWEEMGSSEPCKTVQLNSTGGEYETVEKRFKSSELPEATVLYIMRVQNPVLYEKYQYHKTVMDRNNRKDNERILYHGTSPENVDKIPPRGFNRSYCGANATQHGRGVYFAVSARYSACPKYAEPNEDGLRFMFQCRVLTGRYTKGRHSDKEAPVVGDVTYDSSVDDVTNPRMFVVYMDNHAYPEYIIAFKV